VVKGVISNATVRAWRFNTTGGLEEISLSGGPAKTKTTGAFQLTFFTANIKDYGKYPVILRASGGTAAGLPAGQTVPDLYGIIPDPSALALANGSVTVHLSVASSIAARLVMRLAEESGRRPASQETYTLINRVNAAFGVNVQNDDPTAPASGAALLNALVDTNLDLAAQPQNYNAVGELIEYFAANLQTGALNGQMRLPGAQADAPADFQPFGDGNLQALTGGLSGFAFLDLTLDKQAIGSDGLDTAVVTATLRDAANQPLAGANISFDVVSGPGTLSSRFASTGADGAARVQLTSAAIGQITVRAAHTPLAGGAVAKETVCEAASCGSAGGVTLALDRAVIFAGGTDQALLTATVSSLCGGQAVQDGTLVTFSVQSGSAGLSAYTAATVNGTASTRASSRTTGAVVVRATVSTGRSSFFDEKPMTVEPDPCLPAGIAVSLDQSAIPSGYTTTVRAHVSPVSAAACSSGMVPDGIPVAFMVASGGGSVTKTTLVENGEARAEFASEDLGYTQAVVSASFTDTEGIVHADEKTISILFQNEKLNGTYISTIWSSDFGIGTILFTFNGDGTGTYQYLETPLGAGAGPIWNITYEVGGRWILRITETETPNVPLWGIIGQNGLTFCAGKRTEDETGSFGITDLGGFLAVKTATGSGNPLVSGNYTGSWFTLDTAFRSVLTATGTGGPDTYRNTPATAGWSEYSGTVAYTVQDSGRISVSDTASGVSHDGAVMEGGNGLLFSYLGVYDQISSVYLTRTPSGCSLARLAGKWKGLSLGGLFTPNINDIEIYADGNAVLLVDGNVFADNLAVTVTDNGMLTLSLDENNASGQVEMGERSFILHHASNNTTALIYAIRMD
jgi:hypothetical protein